MTDFATQRKWDRAAATFDVMAGKGPEKRWAPFKQSFFAEMGEGKILFLALGTGLDVPNFPAGKEITAIDISPKMLARAEPRVQAYEGNLTARVMDVHELDFADQSFDQIFTSCTFCSVPRPIDGLKQLHRVLKADGTLHMFEHTGSRYFPFNLMLNLMNLLARRVGPEINRRTIDNVEAAGFTITAVNNIFLDVVKTIRAVKQ